jgi:predicted acyl esterase
LASSPSRSQSREDRRLQAGREDSTFTWLPLIDRNPQKFAPSIYAAKAEDYVAATQRIYVSPARPSHIVLPVVPE